MNSEKSKQEYVKKKEREPIEIYVMCNPESMLSNRERVREH